MTTPEALNALADRVEREEPSFELDSTIYEDALPVEEKRRIVDLPAYTTSLDAALTLVPEGLLVENLGEMRDSGPRTGYWLAQLAPRGPRPRVAPGPITAATVRAACDALPLVSAPTGPLALCAAALRARSALAGDGAPEDPPKVRTPQTPENNNG